MKDFLNLNFFQFFVSGVGILLEGDTFDHKICQKFQNVKLNMTFSPRKVTIDTIYDSYVFTYSHLSSPELMQLFPAMTTSCSAIFTVGIL